MRKLIAGFATSLDGYIEGPKGEIDWIIHDKEQYKRLAAQWEQTDAMLHGRKTYHMVLAEKERSKSSFTPFAQMKHYVFSNSLSSVAHGFILINGDTKKAVEKIKNSPGKNIALFGGASLACSLINLGLVDELVMAVCPVLLGSGKPFFSGINARHDFTLKESFSYRSGLVSLTYEKKIS